METVRFVWRHPCDAPVRLTGTFCGWGPGIPLTQASPGDLVLSATVSLAPGFHQYKYLVGRDCAWEADPDAPTCRDAQGNVNNVVGVPTGLLRVMTFNLRYGTAEDGGNSWQFRRDSCARIIAEQRPAVVLVQEAMGFQLGYLLEALAPRYVVEGCDRYGGRDDEHCAVLWDSEQVRLVSTGSIWLSETPGVPGSKFAQSSFPRMSTWAVLAAPWVDSPVLVASTHLDHLTGSGGLRESQARVLCRELRRHQQEAGCRVAVVGGDFNEGRGGPAYNFLVGEGEFSCDTWLRAKSAGLADDGGCKGSTYHGFFPVLRPGGATSSGEDHIDWILCRATAADSTRSLVVTNSKIITATRSDSRGYPSDHFPLMSTIRLAP